MPITKNEQGVPGYQVEFDEDSEETKAFVAAAVEDGNEAIMLLDMIKSIEAKLDAIIAMLSSPVAQASSEREEDNAT